MSDNTKQWLFLFAVLLFGIALAGWIEAYEREVEGQEKGMASNER